MKIFSKQNITSIRLDDYRADLDDDVHDDDDDDNDNGVYEVDKKKMINNTNQQ